MDMFLLILFFRGAFHPQGTFLQSAYPHVNLFTVREIAFTQLQVADYTDHEEVIRGESRGSITRESSERSESEAEGEGTAPNILDIGADMGAANSADEGLY